MLVGLFYFFRHISHLYHIECIVEVQVGIGDCYLGDEETIYHVWESEPNHTMYVAFCSQIAKLSYQVMTSFATETQLRPDVCIRDLAGIPILISEVHSGNSMSE